MIQNSQSMGGESPSTNNFQIDPIGLLRRKFWTICFFVLLCTALSVLFYFKAPKTYESTARIYVEDKSAATMSADGEVLSESNVQKYLEMVNSHKVLNAAILNTEGIEDMKSFEDEDDILFTVRENLKVATADNKAISDVIKIHYQCGVEEDCEVILDSIVNSFEDFILSINREAGGGKRESIGQISDKQEAREKVIEAEIARLKEKPYIDFIDEKPYNRYENTVATLQTELDELSSQRLGFETLLKCESRS